MRVRFEMRMFGLVQWAPLRVWVSKHGFSRAGTPWHNYSAAGGFRQENMLMRELSSQEWSAPVPVPSGGGGGATPAPPEPRPSPHQPARAVGAPWERVCP